MDVGQRVSELHARVKELAILRATMERNQCFDAEDVAWVDEELHKVHKKIMALQTSTPTIHDIIPAFKTPLSREAIKHRLTVLGALETSSGCLSNSTLGRRLAEKQRRLEETR